MSEVENICRDLIASLQTLKTVSNPEEALPQNEEDIVRRLVESASNDQDLRGV